MAASILLIDDEEQLRKLLGRIISLEGFEVTQADNLKKARQLLSHQLFDVILCDVKLPDGNGVDFVRETKALQPVTELILLTAYGNIPDGVQAIKNGAFDYITKGNDNDRVIPLIYQAIDKVQYNKASAVKIKDTGTYRFDDIIGTSPTIKDAIALARKISASDASVLITGETGTGKEVFANAIHSSGKRAGKSMVAVNCSAFARDLLEAELFGYKAGAFTGAAKEKKGLVEVADGGTLFLDEIGELNIELQGKLLRLLENGEFIKQGDTKVSKVNLRVIAATNKDLQKSIAEGSFREDLFYRLNVFTLYLPPLREHPDDIILLAGHFCEYYSQRENKNSIRISKEALALLRAFTWKGNIRELRNVMERAVILADKDEILPEHLPYEIQKQQTGTRPFSLASVEKMHIEKVLQYTKGNKTKAAELLDIGLTTLYRKLEEYHIK